MKSLRENETIVERIVEEWQRGIDREANFRRLFEIYYPAVNQFFEKRNFSSEEARDLTQETFVRVYQGMGDFRRDAPFGAWLFLIAANVYRNMLRHRGTQKRAGYHLALAESKSNEDATDEAPTQLSANEPTPLDDVLQMERQNILRAAVGSLPDQMRRCVMLRVYQDLSYQEIATVMRLSVETVKAHLFQARRQLREKLKDYFAVPDF